MKRIGLLIFLFYSLGFSQKKAEIIYGTIFHDDPYSEDFKITFPKLYAESLQRKERVKELAFILNINDQKGLFTHPKVSENDQDLFFAFQNTGGEYAFYTDFEKNQQIVQFPYWGAEIYIENKINEDPWQLTSESKMIGKYICFKATKEYVEDSGGRKNRYEIEAWYAPEIPIKFGPKQYVGLPGLIVELKEDYITYFLKEINYHPKDQPPIVPSTKGVKMTWQEFAEKSLDIKNTAKQALIDGGR